MEKKFINANDINNLVTNDSILPKYAVQIVTRLIAEVTTGASENPKGSLFMNFLYIFTTAVYNGTRDGMILSYYGVGLE